VLIITSPAEPGRREGENAAIKNKCHREGELLHIGKGLQNIRGEGGCKPKEEGKIAEKNKGHETLLIRTEKEGRG